MTVKDLLSIICVVGSILSALLLVPFLIYVVFPFFNSFSPEKKLERLVDEQCVQGNEIAIRIRRDGTRYYYDRDYKLVKAAIEGNENAIRALKLDSETHKLNKF